MKKILMEYEVYEFEELNDKAKKYALNKFNEVNDFSDIVSGTLEEWFKFLMEENDITSYDYKLLYSLSWSQGDGVCFVGNFVWNGKNIRITHNSSSYYHCKSVSIEFEIIVDSAEYNKFLLLYNTICKDLEKNGYETIEYETSEDRLIDYCNDDDTLFFKSGKELNKYMGKVVSIEEIK